MKIQRESFRRAQNAEKIADLCWQLSDLLRDLYVGYEADVFRLHAIAIGFENEFDSLVDSCNA